MFTRHAIGFSAAFLAVLAAIFATQGFAQTKTKVGTFQKGVLGTINKAQNLQFVKLDPATRKVRVEISTFQCENADEDTLVSDGDEPYLIPLAYWVDGTTVKLESLASATVRFSTIAKMHGNLGREGVKAGDLFGVPTATGVFEAGVLPIAPNAAFPQGVPVQMGLVVVACEEDMTTDIIAEVAASQVKIALEDEITKSVRALTPANRDTLSQIVRDRFGHRLIAVLGDTNLLGAADPDNVVGSGHRSWTLPDLERAGAAGIPFYMVFSSTGVKYNVRGIARVVGQQVTKDVTVVIRQVKGVDSLEGFLAGQPDFQARIVIGGKAWMSPEQTGNTINPNWSFFNTISNADVPLTIELFERDGTSADERCDINPKKGVRSLSLRYNLLTGMVTGDVSGVGTSHMVARGGGDSNRAETTFSVIGTNR